MKNMPGRNRRRPIALDKKEFGEIYHVAAALKLDIESRVAIVGNHPAATSFLSFFADPARISCVSVDAYKSRRTTYANVSKSTNIYCSHWSSQTAKQLEGIALGGLREKAAKVEDFLNARLGRTDRPAALIWIREQGFEKDRNSTRDSALQLEQTVAGQGMRAIIIGDKPKDWEPPANNLTKFWEDPIFTEDAHSVASQLLMFHILMRKHGVCLSVGMMSGGMDGAGLFLGLPTISFAPRHKATRRQRIATAIENFFVILFDTRKFRKLEKHSERELEELRLKTSQLWTHLGSH